MGTASPAMQRFATRCVGLQGTNSGIAPGDPNQGGYHNSRNKLYALGKNGDYSLRHPWDARGNPDRFRAFDWGHSTQAAMTLYTGRVRDAYNRRDPRLTGWREVLGCHNGSLIGFDFIGWYTRVPDSSHRTHLHFSAMNEFVDEEWLYDNMFSILRGQSLEDWRGTSDMAEFTEEMARKVHNADLYLWRALTQLDDTVTGIRSGSSNDGTVENHFARLFKQLVIDVADLRMRPVANVEITDAVVETLADRVADRLAARLAD